MSIIEKEKILAIRRNDGSVICEECTTNEEWNDITQDAIITEDDITDDVYVVCDSCKKMIAG